MENRTDIIKGFYDQYSEDDRLDRSRHGRLEHLTTMEFIRRYIFPGAKVLELGAGTGRYSIALAKEGFDVTAVELVESNLAVLRENSRALSNIRAFRGDAADLSRFEDDSFDITLSFGPMYHLYEKEEINRAIDEAIRVTKAGGVILFAFLSVYAIMYANYLDDTYGGWSAGLIENFTGDYGVRHFKEQIFTGYDIEEFEHLFDGKPVSHLTTAGMDGMLEAFKNSESFRLSDADFEKFAAWHLHFSEKRELLGLNNHLLYICKKL